jgi:biotin carboxylase
MICGAVRKARAKGIYTVVTDYYPESPAKQIADKSFLISTSDIEALVDLCLKEDINGVFTGYSEMNLYYAQELCGRLGLPFYADKNHVDLFANKSNFKACCRKFNVGVVPEYDIAECSPGSVSTGIELPVIVKPADSYSGKGITICHSLDDIEQAIDGARRVSKSGTALIEKYMSALKYDVVTVYYSIQDGRVALSSMVDRHMHDFPNNRRLSTALFYPSEYTARYLEEMDEQVCTMLKQLGVKNGTLFIEGCVDEEGFYFWEAGFRLCGAQQAIIPRYVNNIDIEEMLIEYALTGKMSEQDLVNREDPFLKGKVACNLLLFVNEGVIGRIEGVSALLEIKEVVNYTQLLDIGSSVSFDMLGTLDQNFARIHIVSANHEELHEVIRSVFETVKVFDVDGKDMLVETMDFSKIRNNHVRFVR